MRAFLIENGTAVQKAAPGRAAEDMGAGWVDGPDDVVCGYLYDGEAFTPPPPGPEPVPAAVSMRQARLALSRNGLLANAESAIAGMTGSAGDEARIEWEYATELRRDHPLVAALGQTLSLDDAAQDDLFKQAAAIL
ncbi:hypothetical protein ACGYLO_16580 [Sulfitobacter sp. 1A13353]|uniref:hypothetical protein n=1 Tax=Sulfitobacter sp. 1A13353 TaxID=3368568 RepID=UPI003744B34F